MVNFYYKYYFYISGPQIFGRLLFQNWHGDGAEQSSRLIHSETKSVFKNKIVESMSGSKIKRHFGYIHFYKHNSAHILDKFAKININNNFSLLYIKNKRNIQKCAFWDSAPSNHCTNAHFVRLSCNKRKPSITSALLTWSKKNPTRPKCHFIHFDQNCSLQNLLHTWSLP